jgi:purine-nucleoside phosphorylase
MEQQELEQTTTTSELSSHTLGEEYFYGYTTTRELVKELAEVVVRPYASDRDRYIYYRNHHMRSYVEGDTKVVEVSGALLAKQIVNVHRILESTGRIEDIEIKLEVDIENIYDSTGKIFGDRLDRFYDRLQPEGDVVITRPEEFLSDIYTEVLSRSESFTDKFLNTSKWYINRINDPKLTWEDVYEQSGDVHPKFSQMEQLTEAICEHPLLDLSAEEVLNGAVRGYKLTLDGRYITLLSRGWGRDMSYHVLSVLVDEYDVDRVLFNGGAGGIRGDLAINDLIAPSTVRTDSGEREINNLFAIDSGGSTPFSDGLAYNVDCPSVETDEYMRSLYKKGITCVSMESYGIIKALEGTDVPLGILLYLMDLPLEGKDLSKTNYDTEFKKKIVEGNHRMNRWTLDRLGLLDVE